MTKPTQRPPAGLPDKDTLLAFLREAGSAEKTDIARHFGLKGGDRYFSDPERMAEEQPASPEQQEDPLAEPRLKAETELGAKFDIRGFHDAVLGGGAMPLNLLAKRVDLWIAAKKAG